MRRNGAETRERILDEAERLFARRGFDGVSVRQIMNSASLNLGLVHYHFRNRMNLIIEALRRRVEPINRRRIQLLDEAEKRAGPEGPDLERVLVCFFSPVAETMVENSDFARLAGHAHQTPDAGIREEYARMFIPVLHRFSAAIRRAVPSRLSQTQWLCRGHFLLGVTAHTLANFADLAAMARSRRLPSPGELLGELVAFCAAGLRAGVKSGNQASRRKGRSE